MYFSDLKVTNSCNFFILQDLQKSGLLILNIILEDRVIWLWSIAYYWLNKIIEIVVSHPHSSQSPTTALKTSSHYRPHRSRNCCLLLWVLWAAPCIWARFRKGAARWRARIRWHCRARWGLVWCPEPLWCRPGGRTACRRGSRGLDTSKHSSFSWPASG